MTLSLFWMQKYPKFTQNICDSLRPMSWKLVQIGPLQTSPIRKGRDVIPLGIYIISNMPTEPQITTIAKYSR